MSLVKKISRKKDNNRTDMSNERCG